MSATIWGKFFWSDWRSDPGLRSCSYAARGLWIDMLCIAAEAEPKGFVSVAGRACDAKAIARVTGGQIEEVTFLIAELEEHAVFSRDQSGAIFSRRMIADGERSRSGSRYSGRSAELPLDTHKSGGGTPPTQSPESRSQNKTKDSRARRIDPAWQLSEVDKTYATEKNFNGLQIIGMAESFRDHHLNKGTLGLDWAAAWRMWVRNEIKFHGEPQTNGGRNAGISKGRMPTNSRSTTSHADAVLAGMGRVAARYDGTGGSAGPEDRTVAPNLHAAGKTIIDH